MAIDLADITAGDGSLGFVLQGETATDTSGFSVASAGDVNGDGFDDLIVGAHNADPNGDSSAGESYVVFGSGARFMPAIGLASLDGANGFRVDGIDVLDVSGRPVAAAGDVNGDGFGDIIIGAPLADPGGDESAGESYVVFGRAPTDAVTRVGAATGQAIWGGSGDDNLLGEGGGDTLRGQGGEDTLIGGVGNDVLIGGASADLLVGGKGLDFASYAESSAGVRVDLAAGTAAGGDAAGDTLLEIERLLGSDKADRLSGDEDPNLLRGDSGNDTLTGRVGADTLRGGGARDRLPGGRGADRFELESALAANRDTIQDFAAGDEIALRAAALDLVPGALPTGRFVLGPAAGDATDRIIYNQTAGALYFDPDGTGAQAKILIAILANNAPLSASDFMVI